MKYFFIRTLFLTLFISSISFAQPAVETAQQPEVDKYEQQILSLTEENKTLHGLEVEASGQDKLALQLYMFRKNLEIRKVIESALTEQNINRKFLIGQIRLQQKYTQQQIDILSKQTEKLANSLNNAKKDEDRFALVTQYKESRGYLDNAYQAQAQNLSWLQQLKLATVADEQTFRQRVNLRLEQIAATIEFLEQKKLNENQQLKEVPEAEKPAILLNRSITNKQIKITTTSLLVMIALADQLTLETADYKRLHFDITGNITQDLLSKDVLISILNQRSTDMWSWIVENAPQFLFRLFVVAIILLVTRQISHALKKIIGHMVGNKSFHFSQLMQDFFIAMTGKIVWVIGLLIGLSQLGINLTPVLTGFGIAGVIIGFALQDTLSNFAAGMMLLIYRPFDVGDFVLAGGVEGKVSHMSLVNTTIKTFDNQIIIVPNSRIWGDVIKNVTHERVRRVDMVFGVSYSDEIPLVESVLLDIINAHPAVLKSPEPMIKVGELADSSVNFLVRPWVRTEDYWDVYWDVTREVKIRFDKEGITIPFPQQDVHFYHGAEKAQYLDKVLEEKPNNDLPQIPAKKS